jgi:hypothetical protein
MITFSVLQPTPLTAKRVAPYPFRVYVRVLLPGMTERELDGDVTAPSLIDQLARGSFEKLGSGKLDLRG